MTEDATAVVILLQPLQILRIADVILFQVMSTSQPRTKFSPNLFNAEEDRISPLETDTDCFRPLLTCSADFPIELFESAVSQLVHHPEYNSTLILRSEVLTESRSIFPSETPNFRGFSKVNCIHRRLLPRRPGRDGGLEQYCTFYSRTMSDPHDVPDTLVLTPIIPPGSRLPYYHPAVFHIAFRYLRVADRPSTLRIEVLPLPGTPIDPNSRLYRTCLALLETLHRYGWGAVVNYKKRVVHDRLVPREEYQDLYLVMRERHKHLVDTWQEVTDPLKHVFEDIGIATFLMLFWKATYTHPDHMNPETSDPDCPWSTWPRPPGGFLDFGCGNGLLTHILTAEGYQGKGIDVRARVSWAQYSDTTREQLHVCAFDPTSKSSCPFIRPGVFIIGNHADELTPWVPVLATLHKASGYLSIPCCVWSFDAKFERSSASFFPIPISPVDAQSPLASESRIHRDTGLDIAFVEGLNLGGDGNHTSSYSIYRIWLSTLSLHCGWEIECEMLRIPSTRNWAIAGRRRLPNVTDEEALDNAQEIIEQVITRGVFKTRHPEGKARDH